ncbi:MAG: class I SAM-dependent methyltransferase [Chloroflexota bacterium]
MSLWSRLKRRLAHRQSLSSLDAYALWAESYPPYAHNGLMEIEQAAMLYAMPPLTDLVVLDLAGGTGRYGLIAHNAGASQVVGVDNSGPMLHAGIKAGVAYPLAQTTMSRLPFASATFDVIVCGLATGHLPPNSMQQALAETSRVLRPGGEALFSDFHPMIYLRGGRRTFTALDGTHYEVEHYPHTLAAYTDAIRAAGMTIITVDEPQATVNGANVPTVLVIRCQKDHV